MKQKNNLSINDDILLCVCFLKIFLLKAKNKIEALIAFEDMSLLNRANNLAFYELMGDAALINDEWTKYQAVTTTSLQQTAKEIFSNENCNTLFYKKKVEMTQ